MDEIYTLSFRAIYDEKKVKFFTNSHTLKIYDELSFDNQFSQNTSVDFFISGIMSAIILSISKGLGKKSVKFDDLEISSKVFLENSLSYLDVKGYENSPKISKIELKIYIYSPLSFEKLQNICYEILDKSIIYNTTKNLLKIEFSQVV